MKTRPRSICGVLASAITSPVALVKRHFLFLACLLPIFLGRPAHALTLTQIQTEVRLRIKDTSSTRQRYTDTQLLNLINEAQRDVSNASWCVTKSSSFALVSGTTYYSLPADLVVILRVTHAGKTIPETTLDQLDAKFTNSNWAATGGSLPQSYFQDMSQPQYIGFYPWPNTGTSTGTVIVYYVAQPTALSASSDVPFNSLNRLLPYHDLLILYPAYRIYLIEGEVDKATLYRQEYENRLILMRDRVGSKPNYNPGFSGGPNK